MNRFAAAGGGPARPLWSVMIPVYRPKVTLLRETMSSVSAAAHGAEAMQVALVFDSFDQQDRDLADLIEQYRDQGVEVFGPPARRVGIGGNWNRCLANARGHVVHLLHQDDRIRPDFYLAHEAALRAAPQIGASFTQHAFIAADGTVSRHGQWHGDQAGVLDDWHEHVVTSLAIQCPAIVVRRSVYDELGGFDESYGYCLDRAMWQRIAAAYPVWYDPRPLAEYREHSANQTSALSRSLAPWRETRRCVNEGLQLVAPNARKDIERRALYVQARLMLDAATSAAKQGRFGTTLACMVALLSVGGLSDCLRVLKGTMPKAPPARTPSPDPKDPKHRRRRVALLTEFFPHDPQLCVYGVFLRLRRLIAGLEQVGDVDLVFFAPAGREASSSERLAWEATVRSLWPVSGQIRFVRAGRRRRWTDAVLDGMWALRGAVGFMEPRPSMRTSARAPVRSLRRVLSQLQPDLIVAHRISTGASLWRMGGPMPAIVVDVDDLDNVKLLRRAASVKGWPDRIALRIWARLAVRAIRGVSTIASRMLVTSEVDVAKLAAISPHSSIALVANSAESFSTAQAGGAATRVALFVGTFDYGPNREGVEWFVAEVWPLVLQAVPDARLLVVGGGADKLHLVASKHVEVLGFVEDIGPCYHSASVVVCPILQGAGTRIKIIEAAMNGRPVVSTSIGAEGLRFEDGTEIALADNPTQFARACIDLLLNQALAIRMGEAARQRGVSLYSPAIMAAQLAAACADAIEDGTWHPTLTVRAPL